MDYDKLIERLHKEAYGSDIEELLLGASTALSTLQAENEKLRAELNICKEKNAGLALALLTECAPNPDCLGDDEWRAIRAELEQVKRERDAAVSDLTFAVNQYRLFTTDIDLCGLCKFDLPPAGESGQTAECPGFYKDNCFEWRGAKEE